MFLSVWRAERLKLRHSPMWLAFFLLPLIPAFFGTVNYLGNLELLDDLWYSLWTQHTLFSCYFFLPIIIGSYCAYLWRLEHTGHNWNAMLTAPIPRTVFVLVKLLQAIMLTILAIIWTVLLYCLAGCLCGFSITTLPMQEVLAWMAGGIAGGMVICAIQMLFSLIIRSFAVTVGIALLGGLSGLAMTAKGYPLLNPYALICLGMKANNPNQVISYPQFVISCILFFFAFTLFSVWYLVHEDAKTI